jgi:hypothetical protein
MALHAFPAICLLTLISSLSIVKTANMINSLTLKIGFVSILIKSLSPTLTIKTFISTETTKLLRVILIGRKLKTLVFKCAHQIGHSTRQQQISVSAVLLINLFST